MLWGDWTFLRDTERTNLTFGIEHLIRLFFFGCWQLFTMIFADGLISVWAFYAGIMVFGIYIYESLVMDISFDIDDGQE